MLSYKLAQKLKKAGFPFERRYDGKIFLKEGEIRGDWICIKDKDIMDGKVPTLHKIPTLEELIEECWKKPVDIIPDFNYKQIAKLEE